MSRRFYSNPRCNTCIVEEVILMTTKLTCAVLLHAYLCCCEMKDERTGTDGKEKWVASKILLTYHILHRNSFETGPPKLSRAARLHMGIILSY